ncbi:MAG TPA: hypothetical protein PLF78_03805 [Caulobacter sp.]|nr:hypothetical protein [Caulobacter sp.]
MHRRQLLAAAPLALAATAAHASGGAEKPKEEPYVNLAPIALPIAAEGRLINYIFVQLRLTLTPTADAAALRAKEPWFRDAIVRAGHRAPFTLATDYTKIDERRLVATLLQEARAIVGPGKVAGAQLLSQTPKQRSRLPTPAGR